MPDQKWAQLLAYVSGLVNQKLLLQNEYLASENRILRAQLPARVRLSDPERSTLAEIGKRLGRAALQPVACVANTTVLQTENTAKRTARELGEDIAGNGHAEGSN